jgi:hypothetical protein
MAGLEIAAHNAAPALAPSRGGVKSPRSPRKDLLTPALIP